jgi:hypothetical protein
MNAWRCCPALTILEPNLLDFCYPGPDDTGVYELARRPRAARERGKLNWLVSRRWALFRCIVVGGMVVTPFMPPSSPGLVAEPCAVLTGMGLLVIDGKKDPGTSLPSGSGPRV